MKVLVLERRHLVGGAAISEEVFPGYVFSRASYLLSLFRNQIIEDLFPTNWREELVLYKRLYPSFTPLKDGRYLMLGGGKEMDFKEISKFSSKDAYNYPTYTHKLDEIVDIVNPLIDSQPPQSMLDVAKIAWNLKGKIPKSSTW